MMNDCVLSGFGFIIIGMIVCSVGSSASVLALASARGIFFAFLTILIPPYSILSDRSCGSPLWELDRLDSFWRV
jgi:hypothetical protein